MNEDIGAPIATEEAVPLCVVKPLYRSPILCQDRTPFPFYPFPIECIVARRLSRWRCRLCFTDSDAKVAARGFLCVEHLFHARSAVRQVDGRIALSVRWI